MPIFLVINGFINNANQDTFFAKVCIGDLERLMNVSLNELKILNHLCEMFDIKSGFSVTMPTYLDQEGTPTVPSYVYFFCDLSPT